MSEQTLEKPIPYGRVSRKLRPWLNYEDVRVLEQLNPEQRRLFENLLQQQARSDMKYRRNTVSGSEGALDDRSRTEARMQYGAGGGHKKVVRHGC